MFKILGGCISIGEGDDALIIVGPYFFMGGAQLEELDKLHSIELSADERIAVEEEIKRRKRQGEELL